MEEVNKKLKELEELTKQNSLLNPEVIDA